MTPEQQKVIDAAAKVHYERLNAFNEAQGLPYTKWDDLSQEYKEDLLYPAVIGPVTVALRAAVDVAEGFEPGPPDEAFCEKRPDEGELIRALYDRTTDTAAAIASLIPQETQG
jgi:hypothetical protein